MLELADQVIAELPTCTICHALGHHAKHCNAKKNVDNFAKRTTLDKANWGAAKCLKTDHEKKAYMIAVVDRCNTEAALGKVNGSRTKFQAMYPKQFAIYLEAEPLNLKTTAIDRVLDALNELTE